MNHPKRTYLKRQRGATLIVVMIILLIIIVVGILAVRVAIVSLGVATNSQVGQLNFQSSDAPLAWFNNFDPTTVTSVGNVIGAALKENESNPGGEYIFCYKPTSTTSRFAQTKNASLIRKGTTDNASVDDGGVAGFCSLTSDFGSNRPAVVTQVAVSVPTNANNDAPGSNLPRGINVSEGTQLPKSMTSAQRIRVTTTAMLPAYAVDISSVQTDCLSSTNAKVSDDLTATLATGSEYTLAKCLADKGVPFSTQVQEFNYVNQLTEVSAPGS
ncbi:MULTISPECIES: PilX N-terminal domain-containing pilus assembly protein [Acinetobacter]|uniref:PilX N-terminal domain-containing pilus assembly protein n=1 Tax=Acinetobacter TaxID=469 RepID=UPI00051B1C29|nr:MULTISPECIES: PilX N-terminal domain-containing pilus assembly protein [Acinetobacter]MCH7316944.1 pilus assembly protein [Acinetobacter higginsii]MCH7379661.1 pilus assembly protein [Acinetobacter higginsii]